MVGEEIQKRERVLACGVRGNLAEQGYTGREQEAGNESFVWEEGIG